MRTGRRPSYRRAHGPAWHSSSTPVQKETVASTPHWRGSEMEANGVPNVAVVMLLMPVTYWSSSTLVTYAARPNISLALVQPSRRSRRLVASPTLKTDCSAHVPCRCESALQRDLPRYA